MEIRVLRYFLAAAREQTISGAAKTLHLTQPTLSRQLIELEEELGKQLFNRGNRKITLTEEGLILRNRAEEIIELLAKTKAEITTPNEEIKGDIYIGCAETEGIRYLAHSIYEVQKTNPGIRFHFFSGNAENVAEKLERGLLDFGVFIDPADVAKYDFIKLPHVDKWGVLMRKDSALAQKKSISAKDLLKLPVIISNQTMVKNEFSGWLGGKYNKLNIVATYNLLYNASLLVEEGVGYALCLDGIAKTSDDSALCFKPLEPKLEVGLNLVWKKYPVFSKATATFLKYIQNTLQIKQRNLERYPLKL